MFTKDGSFGAFSKVLVAVDKGGEVGFDIVTADALGSVGIVLHDLIINYTGTTGIWITIFNANKAVGVSGGPVIGTTAADVQIFTKVPIQYFFPAGKQFNKGCLFLVSGDAAITTNADAVPSICISYS